MQSPQLSCKSSSHGWTKDDGGRRGYHHGNLREALVRAALDLIAKHGPAGFTFADAARSAGVSSAAPYRHYRDREALLVDVARRGFELFAERTEKVWNDGKPNPYTAFEAVGRAYLAFARDGAAYYSAMFEAGVSLDADPALREAADRAFAVLRRRLGGPVGAPAGGPAAAGPDDEPAHLGDGARHRLAVRARR